MEQKNHNNCGRAFFTEKKIQAKQYFAYVTNMCCISQSVGYSLFVLFFTVVSCIVNVLHDALQRVSKGWTDSSRENHLGFAVYEGCFWCLALVHPLLAS